MWISGIVVAIIFSAAHEGFEVYFKAYPHARVEYSPDNEKFTVVVPPEYVPVFPYNYMTAMPSYRAD